MDLASQALSTLTHGSSTAEREQPVPETWVERIFTRLTAQLGSKVADLYGGIDPAVVKTEWCEALAGFDPSEIARGIEACRTRVFAPTLGEFLRLCRPALDPEIAWIEAVAAMQERAQGKTGEWSHPAVYRAAHQMAYELRTGSFKDHRKRWEWLLNREFPKGWLLGVPKPTAAIGYQPDAGCRLPNEGERQKLADLRKNIAPAAPKEAA